MDYFQLVFFPEPPTGHAYTEWHEEKGFFYLTRKMIQCWLSSDGKDDDSSTLLLCLILFICTVCLSCPPCFVHCQFKPLITWNRIVHAQCNCHGFIRCHLEDALVIINTFAFQLEVRSSEPYAHSSALRNPKIPESCAFTCVRCYTL